MKKKYDVIFIRFAFCSESKNFLLKINRLRCKILKCFKCIVYFVFKCVRYTALCLTKISASKFIELNGVKWSLRVRAHVYTKSSDASRRFPDQKQRHVLTN